MENRVAIEKMQNDILRIIGSIKMAEKTKKHFLGIIGVMFGQEHPDYKLFEDLVCDEHVQVQMLRADENYKYKQHFQVFCHMVLSDIIKQVSEDYKIEPEVGPKSNIPEKDILLEHYFREMEKASKHRSYLLGFDESKFAELKKLEYSLLRKIFPHHDESDPIVETEFSVEHYRQLLTVWFMYTQYIFYPEDIQKVIELCKNGTIKL